MKLFVARHGQTVWNSLDKISGITDVDLTGQGREQARELARQMEGKEIDIIIASPLKRAIDTANIVAEICHVDVVIDDRLIEQNYGIYEGLSPKTPEFLDNKKMFAYKYPEGESMMQVAHRAYGLIEDIKEKYRGKNVMFVTHGGVCRVIHTYFYDLTNDEYFHYVTKNCMVREYDLST